MATKLKAMANVREVEESPKSTVVAQASPIAQKVDVPHTELPKEQKSKEQEPSGMFEQAKEAMEPLIKLLQENALEKEAAIKAIAQSHVEIARDGVVELLDPQVIKDLPKVGHGATAEEIAGLSSHDATPGNAKQHELGPQMGLG